MGAIFGSHGRCSPPAAPRFRATNGCHDRARPIPSGAHMWMVRLPNMGVVSDRTSGMCAEMSKSGALRRAFSRFRSLW